ncbi:MAG TPA: MoaD/ThiS family protein [Nitrososphaerales archaeon]|nr:MoaD/ThiS family protein [Nitrososphaerales archaeon]
MGGKTTNVRVLYFAVARELASKSVETFTLSEGSSVGDLAKEVQKTHPALKTLRNSAKFSVNLAVVDDSTILKNGDEVGVLPPVAGG